jgi:hypothetical protein
MMSDKQLNKNSCIKVLPPPTYAAPPPQIMVALGVADEICIVVHSFFGVCTIVGVVDSLPYW